MYPFPGFHNIYNEIKTMFYECLKLSNQESQKQYYIECWLNVYNPTDYIDWHSHCKPEHNTWFGIYCINVEPSKTTFDFPDVDGYIDVHGTNNLLVMLKGDENLHRTWPWEYPTPRITVAFNIVPNDSIDTAQRLNHWIPI